MLNRNKLKLEQAFYLCCANPNYKVLFAVSDVNTRKELMMYAHDLAIKIGSNKVLSIFHTTAKIYFYNDSEIILNTPECSLGYSVNKVWVDEAMGFSLEWEQRLKTLERNVQ